MPIDIDELDRLYVTADRTLNREDEWLWAESVTTRWPALRDELRMLREFAQQVILANDSLADEEFCRSIYHSCDLLAKQRQPKETP